MGRRFKKSMVIDTDLEKGVVKIFVDGRDTEVASADFVFDETQIRVTNVATSDAYKKSGYGRLLFDALKCLSQQHKKPLILWALDDAIPFYEKIGMLHLDNPSVQNRLIFGNVTAETLADKVDEDDFVYIPQGLKGRPTIYL
jgi:N-acetylglutamate synthase-like GNAT family acetyltransferase